MSKTLLKILIIEDNPGDVELTRVGLAEKAIANHLTVISDGHLALEYFDKGENLPDVVLLDINLPKVNGFEILKKIRNSDMYKKLPVIMLTSSDARADKKQSLEYKANCYLTKPVNFDAFYAFVNRL